MDAPTSTPPGASRCSRCGGPLPAGFPAGPCPACLVRVLDAGDAAPVAARQHVGDYELLEPLGRGGFGVVWKARHLSLGRIVALKMVSPEGASDPRNVERFLREARRAGRLQHQNIVPVLDFGADAGRHFFTMPLMAGGSLAQRLCEFAPPSDAGRAAGDRLRQEKIARLLATVARAVHHAHSHPDGGVIHRDLKPDNILFDEAGQPHVADFGLARATGADASVSLSGALAGTPHYMAPEQFTAPSETLTPGCDLFSLGVVFYQLLTGQLPFAAREPLALAKQIASDEPVPPRQLCPSLDPDLEAVCLKCLEKSPARRYATAAALADHLELWLRGESVPLPHSTSARRVGRWLRREPWRAAACLFGLGVAATGVGLAAVCFVALPALYPVPADAELQRFTPANGAAPAPSVVVSIRDFSGARFTPYFANPGVRKLRLEVLNTTTNWQARCVCQIKGVRPFWADAVCSPRLRHGDVFVVNPEVWRHRAYYFAEVGWDTAALLAKTPQAQIRLTPVQE